MKSILYVGATLMIGASIYGFVDYQQSSHKKEFKNMYKEEPVADQPVVVTDKKTTDPVINEKNMTLKKQVAKDDKTIPAIKPIADEEKMLVQKDKEIDNTGVTVTPSKEDAIKHKKRVFSTRLFSRAPLDERYIKEIKIEEPKTKTETIKPENKEQ